MQYKELHEKYVSLLKLQTEKQLLLSSLPSGYISKKRISSKSYSYLQKRTNGKVTSVYVKDCDLKSMEHDLSLRAEIEGELQSIVDEINKLEDAARLISKKTHQTMMVSKRCVKMDALPKARRQASLSFAGAMTALEGVPASGSVDEQLGKWALGEQSFSKSYKSTLKKYNLE